MSKSSYFKQKSHPYTGDASRESFRKACDSVYHNKLAGKREDRIDTLTTVTIVWGIIGVVIVIAALVIFIKFQIVVK